MIVFSYVCLQKVISETTDPIYKILILSLSAIGCYIIALSLRRPSRHRTGYEVPCIGYSLTCFCPQENSDYCEHLKILNTQIGLAVLKWSAYQQWCS